MRILHQKLHLQHHHHTGKVLHHRHTSFRSLALVFVVAAAAMASLAIMQRVTAESIAISVTVHVPRPQTPAVLALPADGTTIPDGDTLLAGSCPILSPQAVILVNVDGAAVGSAVCDTNNNFSLSANLQPGAHTITADAYSIDGDKGPTSQALHVTCRAVVHPGSAAPAQPFSFSTDSAFTTIGSSKDVAWSGTITGSKGPYKITVDWGDGTYGSYTVQAGTTQARHRYANLASYNITVGAADSTGNYQHQQFAATASTSENPFPLASESAQPASSRTATVVGLYGLFVTVVCVAAIVRLHAVPFAYTNITLKHHAAH